MKSPTYLRTVEIVSKSVKNYPVVIRDMSLELKDLAQETMKANLMLLRLLLKCLGIILFPLWILPLALAMYITFCVCEANSKPRIPERNF